MIRKGDFVEVEYEIRTETGEEVEKKKVKTIVGLSFLYPFIERKIIGMEEGKKEIVVEPEEAFGKRDPNLIQILKLRDFLKNGIKPRPGLIVEVDGQVGKVITVSGGRVVVDFNHPLAGKRLICKLSVRKISEKIEDKIKFISEVVFGREVKFELNDKRIILKEDVPSDLKETFKEYVKIFELEVV